MKWLTCYIRKNNCQNLLEFQSVSQGAHRPNGLLHNRRDGVLVINNAVTSAELKGLRTTFCEWVEESRFHSEDFGQTNDGRKRFDLQSGHDATNLALRRVQSPEEISDTYANVMRRSKIADCCAELIGPNIRFHHGKVNSKLPGSATAVKCYQDFPFQPMPNDDMITCLLFIDDVTIENGPLEVIPGSHIGPLYSHWQNGVFTGSIEDSVIAQQQEK